MTYDVPRLHVSANDNQVMEARTEYIKFAEEQAVFMEESDIKRNIWNMPANSVKNFLWFLRFELPFWEEARQKRRESIRLIDTPPPPEEKPWYAILIYGDVT